MDASAYPTNGGPGNPTRHRAEKAPGAGRVWFSNEHGDVSVDMRTWYSKTTPRLEVVQSHPGTVWTPLQDGFLDKLRAAAGPPIEDSRAAYSLAKRGVKVFTQREAARPSSMASTCSSTAG